MKSEKWNRVVLRDICEKVNYGYTASAKQDKIGPKFLRITDIVPERIDWSSVPYCKIEDKNLCKYQLERGDIVIARTGATTGYAKWIRNNHKAVFASYLVRIRINQEHDNRYVGFIVESDEYKRFIKANISGAAQPQANAQVLTSFPIPLPPLPTQRKIASILSAYDDLIENNTRRIKILEEMAQTIYREWFVHFRFPGHEKVKMVESEMGLMPEGWEVKKVDEFTSNHIGGGWGKEESDSKHIVPAYVIRGTDIPKVRCLNTETCPLRYHTLSNLKSRELKPNDIIIEVSGGSKDWGVGRSTIVTSELLSAFDKPVICASFCKRLRLNDEIFAPLIFIFHLWETYNNRSLEQYELRSTGLRNFQFSVFLERELLPIPPPELQKRFLTHLQPLIDSIQNLGLRNANLRQTRNLLLPKLISGELDVSELDVDMLEV